ncbi:MAG: restriction endonuclease subunit S [Candidatus Omnitrophica bacterium]|nr:restriction endonuclease subunit S [Candidatus Omnitrophota bacterium]
MKKTCHLKTEIEEIPSVWKEYVFSEVVSINPKRELRKGSTARFVSMSELNEFNKKIQSFTVRTFSGGSKFINGDTLMARITPCLENGKTAFVDILESGEVGCGSTEFIVLGGKDGKSISQFVYYLAISPQIRQAAIKSMTGTSGRQRVESDVFDKLIIDLPDIVEQHAIAKILSDLDEKIELNYQMNKTLEAMGQALFKRWFVDFELPNDQGKPYRSSGGTMVNPGLGEIPRTWEIKPLDQIAKFLNGLALQKYPPKGDKYLPVIKIRELNQGITASTDKAAVDIEKEFIVDDGDVLFSWSGSLRVCIWCDGKGALNQHLFKVTSDHYPKWFYYQWVKFHLPEFQQIAQGKATTMGHIQRHHLSASPVVIPPHEILAKMSRTMAPLLDQIIVNGVEIRKLSEIRDSLLPKLMSGKIRVG